MQLVFAGRTRRPATILSIDTSSSVRAEEYLGEELANRKGANPARLHLCSTLHGILFWTAALLGFLSNDSFGQPLETLNASYASVTGSRIPLWIAKDAGLFEKQGLHVNLVVIAAGNAAIGALAGGDVEILGAPGSTTMVSAARGLPVAIIGTFGPGAWKLAAHPSITTIQELRGKTVGISRPGTTIEFATRRALLKLGFAPGKDVNIFGHGSCRVEQAPYDHASGQDRCDPGESGQSL